MFALETSVYRKKHRNHGAKLSTLSAKCPLHFSILCRSTPLAPAEYFDGLYRERPRLPSYIAGQTSPSTDTKTSHSGPTRDHSVPVRYYLILIPSRQQGWHFSRQEVFYAICRFKPVFTGKKWQKLAKNSKIISHFCCSFYSRCLSLHSQCIAINL